jgi:tetratricopeptide (TPR) repeat protein
VAPGGRSRNRGVGRAGELATAAFLRDTARAGRGGVVTVTGPSGCGKTWLCESIAEAATDEGFRIGWGTGWPGGGVPPLWPWQQALEPFGERSTARELFAAPPDLDGPEWFARCVAVVDHLRELSADRPTLVILDDAHHADEPSRGLAYFVARHVRALPLLLVVAHQPSDDLAVLDRDATAIPLRGLDPGEAGALLADRGVQALPPDDLGFVVGATGGLPGALHRLANRGTDPADLVGALVDEQLAELPADLARTAGLAAVAGAAPRLGEVAALLDAASDAPGAGVGAGARAGADSAPLALAAELERRGLARRAPPDLLAFGHERVRSELVARLDPADVLDAHRHVALLLGDQPPSRERLLRRAEHARAAAGRSPGDALRSALAAQEAAAVLVEANEPQPAADLLAAADAAHESAGFGPSPAALLASLGGALQRCGRLAAARDVFRRAASAAEKERDPISLALAALGLGGVWLAEERSPIGRQRFFDLTARARAALPDDEVVLRLRLDVRMAAEIAYESGDYSGIEAQVAAARALDDPMVLAEALSLYHNSMLGPKRRDKRAAIAEEMVAVAARADDHAASLMALLWLTTDQFLAGSTQAERTLHELHERSGALSGRHAAYIASVMDVTLLQREGRLAEAEAAAEAAFAVGLEVGDADALGYYGGQVVVMRWIQGRSAEVLELAAQTEASPTITPFNKTFTASLASLAAAAGDLDRARTALSRLAGGLQDIHQSSVWLATLYSVVEAAYALGDAEIAREAAEQMAPYADLPVIGSMGVSCLGSARRSLGLAAVTAGDLDTGIEQLGAAVAANERLGNRPLAALTSVELARARARRDDAARGDRPAALALLDQAIREAEAMDLPLRATEWREDRAAVAAATAGPSTDAATAAVGPPPSPSPSPASGTGAGTIERRGRSWVLSAGGHEVLVPDLLGMTYLVQLLTNPRVEIAAAVLVGEAGDSATTVAMQRSVEQPLLDPPALAAYRRRVTELEDELAEAERFADDERAARARIELDAVVDELARTTNRFGRTRSFSSSNERARTAVQKAVRRTLDHIAHEDPTLGAMLRASVRTGRTCCYDPAPGAAPRWTTTLTLA